MSRHMPWTDHELVLRVDCQEWAFIELLARHKDILYNQARQFSLPGASRSDVEQVALIGFYKGCRDFRPDRGRIRSFLSLAVRAELVTALVTARRGKHQAFNEARRLEEPIDLNGDALLGEAVAAPEATEPHAVVAIREELRELIDRCLSRLSEFERAALVHHLEGHQYADAARVLGVSEKAFDNALQRGRSKLREAA